MTRGALLPHFVVRATDGCIVNYGEIWQQRNLAVIVLPDTERAAWVDAYGAARREFAAAETELVITSDRIPGGPSCGVIVADRWGEVVHIEAYADPAALPAPGDLLEWVQFARMRCPECEGETR